MGYNVDCFKKFEIKNKMDYSGDFTFEMVDYENGDFIYPSSISEIYQLMERHGLEFDLVPNLGEVYLESLSLREAKVIAKRMIKPEECLEFITKHSLLDKVEVEIPDCLITLQNIIKRWKDGFYVIRTY